MDQVRALIIAKVAELRLDLANVSRDMGRNPAYLQQFLRRGVPRSLKEEDREKLAPLIGVQADDLRSGGKRIVPADDTADVFAGQKPRKDAKKALLLAIWDVLEEPQREEVMDILWGMAGFGRKTA